MRLTTRHAFGMALLAFALCATASQASANELYRGAVDLPFETHWGNAVLQAGHYNITMESGPSGLPMISVLGPGGQQRILVGTLDLKPRSEHGSLTLVNVGGTYIVRRFDAGVIGRSFDFLVPKMSHSEIGRTGAPTETSVGVYGTH